MWRPRIAARPSSSANREPVHPQTPGSASGFIPYSALFYSEKSGFEELDLVVTLAECRHRIEAEPVEAGGVHRPWVEGRTNVAIELIAEIDSPMGGIIRVAPENLQSLAASLRAP